jgi:aminopeptidase N
MRIDVRDAEDPAVTSFGSITQLSFTAAHSEPVFVDYEAESISRIELNGEDVDLAEALTPGRVHITPLAGRNTVIIEGRSLYSRSGEGLHRFVDPADGQTYLYTQYEPADCRRVFATFEQPDLKATYELTLLGPEEWILESNTPAASREILPEGGQSVAFEKTKRFSTYITAILAGPYHVAQDVYSASDAVGVEGAQDIELRLFCRQTLKDLLPAELLFETTKKGLSYYQTLFNSPYPWGGTYAQAFVPEYNLGAMENPGLVTFTEEYLYRGKPTDLQIESRANTLLHEMAHMWFGDLVTMEWWDDLWLKESFADFMGTLAVAEALDRPESWVTFANRRKAWAYVMDQGPTTHPIVADIPDLEAARQNFDGITYAKGASVLKQLVAYVGREAFVEAARAYFARHAYGNASLADLLDVLSDATGKDMRSWAALWLQTSGVSRLAVDVVRDDAGRVTSAVLRQDSVDPVSGIPVVRPHSVMVGAYELRDGAFVRTWSQSVVLDGRTAALEGLICQPSPDVPSFLLANDDDLTYATLEFSRDTRATLTQFVHLVSDPLAQAVILSNLWDMVRHAVLPARDYVGAALRVAAQKPEIGLATVLLQRAVLAAKRFAPVAERSGLFREIADASWAALEDSATPQALATQYAYAAAALARTVRTEDAEALLAGAHSASRTVLDDDVTWEFVVALASAGRISAEEITRRYAEKPSASADRMRRQALAALPGAQHKRDVWEEAWTEETLSNDAISALAAGFARADARVLDPIRADYTRRLLPMWSTRSQEIASRLVGGFFPSDMDADGRGSHPFVDALDTWFAENADAPAALKRLLTERLHEATLQLTAQRRGRDGI